MRVYEVEYTPFSQLKEEQIEALNCIYDTAQRKKQKSSFESKGYIHNSVDFSEEFFSGLTGCGRAFFVKKGGDVCAYATVFDNVGQSDFALGGEVERYFEHEREFIDELQSLGSFAYIDQMVVREKDRDKGIAEDLLKHIDEFYAERAVYTIGAIVHETNFYALSYFLQRGFTVVDFYLHSETLWYRVCRYPGKVHGRSATPTRESLSLTLKLDANKTIRSISSALSNDDFRITWTGWIHDDTMLQSIPASGFTFYQTLLEACRAKNGEDEDTFKRILNSMRTTLNYYRERRSEKAASLVPHMKQDPFWIVLYGGRGSSYDLQVDVKEQIRASLPYEPIFINIEGDAAEEIGKIIGDGENWEPWGEIYRLVFEADKESYLNNSNRNRLWLHFYGPTEWTENYMLGCFFSIIARPDKFQGSNLHVVWNSLSSVLSEPLLYYKTRHARQYALKSAVASIMARNMDHLLGSHIETAVTHQMPHLRKAVHQIAYEERIPSLPSLECCTDCCYADDFWQEQDLRSHRKNRTARAEIDKAIGGLETTYSNYRLKRMDLIARFSTEWIPWGAGMSFFHQVMLPFLQNGILLHFLGHGENVHLRDIHFEVLYPSDTSPEEDAPPQATPRVRMHNGNEEDSKEKPFYKLPLAEFARFEPYFHTPPLADFMRIRGGDVGAHAYHILLENILRNSAKHGRLEGSPKIKLKTWAIRDDPTSALDELNFKIRDEDERKENFQQTMEEDGDRFWFILISSSADHGDDDAATQSVANEIDELLCRPLVQETGETDPEAWGMKEKKICAAYLAELDSVEANARDPQHIWAGTLLWPDDEKRLAYCLKIPKARFLLHVKDTSTQADS